MANNNNYIGNLSTIIKWLSMAIAGYCIGALAQMGLNLPIDQMQLSEIIGMLIFLGVGYVDSKYPNTFSFLGNNDEIEDIDPAAEYEKEHDYPVVGDEDDGC